MKLFELFSEVHYIIKRTGRNQWSMAKFSGRKEPETVYTIEERKPGVFWTDSPGFSKVGQDVKTIRIIKQFIADGEPEMAYYKAEPNIVGYKFGTTQPINETFSPEIIAMPAFQFVEWLTNHIKEHPYIGHKMLLHAGVDAYRKKMTPEQMAAKLYDDYVSVHSEDHATLSRKTIEAMAREELVDDIAEIMSARPTDVWASYADPKMIQIMGRKPT